MAPKKLCYSVEEAAEALGIGRTLAWNLVRSGKLPHLRVGRRVLIPIVELESWIRERNRGKA